MCGMSWFSTADGGGDKPGSPSAPSRTAGRFPCWASLTPQQPREEGASLSSRWRSGFPGCTEDKQQSCDADPGLSDSRLLHHDITVSWQGVGSAQAPQPQASHSHLPWGPVKKLCIGRVLTCGQIQGCSEHTQPWWVMSLDHALWLLGPLLSQRPDPL